MKEIERGQTPFVDAHRSEWEDSDDTYDAWLAAMTLAEQLEQDRARLIALLESRNAGLPENWDEAANALLRDLSPTRESAT